MATQLVVDACMKSMNNNGTEVSVDPLPKWTK